MTRQVRLGTVLPLVLLIPLVIAFAGQGNQARSVDGTAEADTGVVAGGVVAGGVAFPAEPVRERTVESPTGTTFSVGQVIAVHDGGEPWADLRVVEVAQESNLPRPAGYSGPWPVVDGNVFVSVRVSYLSRADGVEANHLSFQLIAAGQAVDALPWPSGPQPRLATRILSRGHTVEGWLTYEVPAAGPVVLGYGGNRYLDEEPIFVVVLRET